MKLPFPKSSFRMPVKSTFTITDPSFRCRFTFFPMNDFALFKLKLSIGSFAPVYFFLGYIAPALFADRQFFAFHHYIQFDVFAFAFVIPRIFTVFQFFDLHISMFCISICCF